MVYPPFYYEIHINHIIHWRKNQVQKTEIEIFEIYYRKPLTLCRLCAIISIMANKVINYSLYERERRCKHGCEAKAPKEETQGRTKRKTHGREQSKAQTQSAQEL